MKYHVDLDRNLKYLNESEIEKLKILKLKEIVKKKGSQINSSIYMIQIRFLENHLDKYKEVQLFDIKDSSTHKQAENNHNIISKEAAKSTQRDNFLIYEEENQKVVKKIGEGATSIAFKVIEKRSSQVMCKKVIKTVDDKNAFKKLQNSME
ncbi:hypothetical protein M9Y10_009594 [Tritrichomonas musculus]|uniref:Protein kinase domain-containing protein n=1 Tax=Tritrichomonas musculus TaxID=1915356 RepID=A0ABR2IPP3_9EUKA